jgi:hypothetical protein
VGYTEIVSELKAHLEQAGQLAVSHAEPLLALAGRIESDPLVQAAVSIVVPDSSRGVLASFLRAYEQDTAQITQAAAAAAEAAAAAAAAEPAAEPEQPA